MWSFENEEDEELYHSKRVEISELLHTFVQALYGYDFSIDDAFYSANGLTPAVITFCNAETATLMLRNDTLSSRISDSRNGILFQVACLKNAEVLALLLPLHTDVLVDKALLYALNVDVDDPDNFHKFDGLGFPDLNGICVKVLLEHGANSMVRGRYDRTPLHYAAARSATSCVKILLEYGASTESKDDCGRTPLHYASSRQTTDCLKLLLEHGADIESKDNDGRTPLHYASRHHDPLTKALLRTQYSFGFTRDSMAIRCDFKNNVTECIKLLLKHGANPNALDGDGRTSLQAYIDASAPSRQLSATDWRESIACFFCHGANPMLPAPVIQCKSLNDKTTREHVAMNRDEDYLDKQGVTEERKASYYQALRDIYPEIIVDTTGTVYWDVKERLEGPAYGSCWYTISATPQIQG